MAFQFHRYMRTPHSEIYGFFSSDQVEKGPVGRVDIHYSLYGLVNGLVVMEQDLSEIETEELIAKIDDELVEMTTIDDENFEITVAFATKVLTFDKEENDKEQSKAMGFSYRVLRAYKNGLNVSTSKN